MMKTNFYFILKAFFLLKTFIFFPNFFVRIGKRLDRKTKVNFRIYVNWEKMIIMTIHLLPSILRCLGNQIIKFHQLIEYIFLQNSWRK